MRLQQGETLKAKGMSIAAEQRPKSLRLAQEYLYTLAQRQETVTADDAQAYIEREGLSPLGNAAGSLFREKHWEFTGEWEPSARTTNHAHRNRQYRLREGAVRVSKGNPTPTPQQPPVARPEPQHEDIKPMSPAKAHEEFRALEDLYEHTAMSSESYDAAKRKIYRALGLWGEQQ